MELSIVVVYDFHAYLLAAVYPVRKTAQDKLMSHREFICVVCNLPLPFSSPTYFHSTVCSTLSYEHKCFSALTLLVGQQERHPACKN